MRDLKIGEEQRRAGERVGGSPNCRKGNFKNRAEYERREK
jgi:hypothetical protein